MNLKGNYQHGFSESQFHNKYMSIRARCKNVKNAKYFGRGIKCEWLSFMSFKEDMYESYVAHVELHGKKQTTIDRINPNDNYNKANCRWATFTEQRINQRRTNLITFNGKSLTMKDWGKELGILGGTIQWRVSQGWPIEKALSVNKFRDRSKAWITRKSLYGPSGVKGFVGEDVVAPISKRGRPQKV